MRSGLVTLMGSLFVLGKPRVSLLLFLTSFTAFIYARQTHALHPLRFHELILFIGAGMLAPMGANAINNFLDRDIDPLMKRTRNRPLASGRISPLIALVLGASFLIASSILFGIVFNEFAAILAFLGGMYYIVVYTILLKRRTPWSTVVGGLAGSFPPLVGWVAGTGELGLTGLLLALVIFFWNPPHFWALAMHLKEDYKKAGLPMMPIIAGAKTSFTYMLIFTILTITTMTAVALVEKSPIIGAGAIISGLLMSKAMHAIYAQGVSGALRAFKLSNPALGVFFLSLVIDAFLN